MTSDINIIKNALEYYDTKLKKITKNVHYIKIIHKTKDMERNIIKLFDNNDNIILESKYELIGMLTNKLKIWMWAWSNPKIHKNNTYISKKILNYGLNLSQNELILKTKLITSRFIITSPIQIQINIALATYLSKTSSFYEFMIDPDYSVSSSKIYLKNDNNIDSLKYYIFLLDTK
jgi:hypothetical protein